MRPSVIKLKDRRPCADDPQAMIAQACPPPYVGCNQFQDLFTGTTTTVAPSTHAAEEVGQFIGGFLFLVLLIFVIVFVAKFASRSFDRAFKSG